MKQFLLIRAYFLTLPVLIFFDRPCQVSTFEPITTGFALVGAGVISLFANYNIFSCRFYECCESPHINLNITGLSQDLKSDLYGQHLVSNVTTGVLKGHMTVANPAKALVMSFHGWTGGGKNFVSNIIANNLYKEGTKSKYYHIYVSTLHFPHASKIETYKNELRQWIRGNVSQCARSMFVFDEMDKMPSGLIDVIHPFLDHHPQIDGVDYRKSVFIFLSNTAGNKLTKKTLEHWKAGKNREDIKLKEMEEIITFQAFNEPGGLWHSSLIEKNLITAFIPFLPLERQHVKDCIRADLLKKGFPVEDKTIDQVADLLLYFPDDLKLYSKSGCKRVSEKVNFIKFG